MRLTLSDFDYDLPEEAIAQAPAEPRDSSRLMVIDRYEKRVEHRIFRDIVHELEPDDVLVVNDTRVSALRVYGTKATGGRVELLLMQNIGDSAFEALVSPGRRLQPGAVIRIGGGRAIVEDVTPDGRRIVRFDDATPWREALAQLGETPLPPYIHDRTADPDRYQTVYSAIPGSSAAPTAGLHFTEEVLERIREKGVRIARVTLDVSLDTFRPIRSEDPADHKMHGERWTVSEEAAETINDCKGSVIAVGTTSVRTLESAAVDTRRVAAGSGVTTLFITPGYEFQAVDGLITNFHMPRTTMLLLVAALCGREMLMASYETALSEGYRFLSFGDSMFIKPRRTHEKR
ncbi:MAG: tRNA preQ1(34) S-adenosylmethionine ribosyltransferase-isomerase QueA [Armatimonadetes bacterium]|nr:tRNA preQ1(34) S-adenosylmethionine ribosyltransferase-isomerase QueA [Armatimonadota bacterium]NOG93794.1 tRNA preQ1(34) S-adenosylmethionine ribosyltransferase-isomerase QueA [Armatimonadota bacterium]